MQHHRNIFKDIFIFTLPVVVIFLIVYIVSLISFYHAEIVNFHGYLTRNIRIGGLKGYLKYSLNPLIKPEKKKYLPNREYEQHSIKRYNISIKDSNRRKLMESIPSSAKQWVSAWLIDNNKFERIKVKHRGQLLKNYFWSKKAWEIKTRKNSLINGLRIINLTPLNSRAENYLSLKLARSVGLLAPDADIVQLFINKHDQGLYVQEEEIDESMIRFSNRMPGDIFYGELFLPKEPDLSTNELFSNPFSWVKKSRNNRHSDEFRPHLTELLDHICSNSSDSYEKLYSLLDINKIALFYALLTFQGDQHIDHSHNHKLYFNPLSGKFEAILWNPFIRDLNGIGIESFANRFFYKLARDPRFLDHVHEILYNKFILQDKTTFQLNELKRIKEKYFRYSLSETKINNYFNNVSAVLSKRSGTFKKFLNKSELLYTSRQKEKQTLLSVYATSLSSLKLKEINLNKNVKNVQLFEDRDFNGNISEKDRKLKISIQEGVIKIETADALIYPGRDFSSPYFKRDKNDSFLSHRSFTRMAPLKSSYIIDYTSDEKGIKVTGITAKKSIGSGLVSIREGIPDSMFSVESIHPWSFPKFPKPKKYYLKGNINIDLDIIILKRDTLVVEPGTHINLGPNVSIISYSKVRLENVTIKRLNPKKPWGVIALQGEHANGSIFNNCNFSGGSHDTYRYIYYSGMVSVYYADDVTISNCTFSDNLLGDDMIRFGNCLNLKINHVNIKEANGDAIDCDLSEGEIRNSIIDNSRNDGIDLMTARVNLYDNEITNAGDKGISLGEKSMPKIFDCKIVNSKNGIAIKDASDPLVQNVHFIGNGVAVNSYDKNWRYPGGGKGTLIKCSFKGNVIDISLDKRSSLILKKCKTEKKYSLPDNLTKGQFIETDSLTQSSNIHL